MIDRILKIYGDVNTTANGFPPENFEERIESTGIETIKIKILNEAANGKESTAQNTTHNVKSRTVSQPKTWICLSQLTSNTTHGHKADLENG